MQRYDDKRNWIGRRGSSDGMPTLLTVNGIIVLTLICLALRSPSAGEWISAAAQAEFVGIDVPAASPARFAQPADAMQTIRTD